MAIKAADLIKKKGQGAKKSKNSLLDWIGKRRKAGKKTGKAMTVNGIRSMQEDDDEEC